MTARIIKAQQQQGDRNYALHNILSVNKKAGKAESIRKFSRTGNDGTNNFAKSACKDGYGVKLNEGNKSVEPDERREVKHKTSCNASNLNTNELARKIETRSCAEKNAATARARYSVSETPTNTMKTTREIGSSKFHANSTVSEIPDMRVNSTKSEQNYDKGPTDLEFTSNGKASGKNYVIYNIQSVSKNANKLQSNARKCSTNGSYTKRVSDNTNNLKPIRDNKVRIVNNVNPTSEGTATEQLTSELKHLLCLKGADIKKIEAKLKQTARNALSADNVHRNSSEMALLFFSAMRNLLEELITNALSEDANTRSADKIKPVVHKCKTSKRENDNDLSYYEHYLKEIINIFKQEYGCGETVLANKSDEKKIETNRRKSNQRENGSTAICVTGSLKVKSEEDREVNEGGEVLSDYDLSNKWYITPYMIELMKEIKHLLQGESWTKQNNRNYLTLTRNTVNTPVKPQVNKNSSVEHSVEQTTIDTKVGSVRTNNCMPLDSKTMETDVYSKRAVSPVKQDSYVVTFNDRLSSINEDKSILEKEKTTNIDDIGLVIPHNDNTVTCTENIPPSCLNDRKSVVCAKNSKLENLMTTSKEENKMFDWTLQENQKERPGKTTEQPSNCFGNQAARRETFIIQDRWESKDQPIPYGDWYVTNDKISQCESGIVSHQNAQNVDILFDKNNDGASTKIKMVNEELENNNTIDGLSMNKQPLFSFEERKAQICVKPKDLKGRGERKEITTKEDDEKPKQSLTRNEIFHNKENVEQNEAEKEKYKGDSGYDFKQLHPFEITLQHVITMFLCLCHKLNSVPLDTKFTPIISLDPPETLSKAILLLPLFIGSISEALSKTLCRGYDANESAENNMYYELQNILDVFGSICKRSTERKELTKHQVLYNNGHLITEEMYPSYRTSDVTDILNKENVLREHRIEHDVPDLLRTDTLVDENSHRLSANTTDKETKYSNGKLDETQVALAMNNQLLYSFEENKYVHVSDTLISGVYRVPKSVPNATEGNLNNLFAKFGTEHSVSLGLVDRGERNITGKNNANKKSNQSSNSDNDFKDVKYIEQEKRRKGHLKEDSKNNLAQLHPFEITLQAISDMLISVCIKLYSVPTDILFTPILNLNPPETLTKVVFLLPLLTENICGLSFRTSCKDYTATASADENICYEIENILDIFAKAHKELMLNDTNQLSANISENNYSETIVRKFSCLSNSATNSDSLNTLPKKVDGNELDISNISRSSKTQADNEVNTSDSFVPIASNESNNFILYKTLQLFLVGRRTQ